MKKIIYSILMMTMAAFTFTSCEDVPMPYDMPGTASETDEPLVQLVGDGTVENPYNVASALYLITEGNITEDNVYVEGIISQIDEIDTGTFGNATYYISDDGTTANHLEVYRGYSLGGAKFKSDTEIKVGDKVIVYGQLVYYNQKTPEFTQGNYIYSLNGQTAGGDGPVGEAKGTGTQADPFNVAGAIAKCKEIGTDPSTEKYYIKGTAQEDATADASYNNITFDIADTDGGAQFTCYQVAGTDGKPLPSGFTIKKGDEVVVYGPIYNYKGNTPETEGKSAAYIVSVNGKATGEGGGDTPSTDAKKVTVAEFNAAEVNDNVWYQLTGTVENLKDGDQYGNFDLKDETGSVYVYGLLSEKGGEKKKFQELAAAKGIKNGSKITIIGTRGVFNDKIEVLNAYFVSIEGGGGSGEQGGGGSGDGPGTVSGNTITVNAADFGVENGVAMGTQTLSDGTKLEFDGGGNSNAPKYYSSGTTIRMYPKNSVTITASKNIQKVVLNCDEYQGTIYTASGDVAASPGTVAVDGKIVTISGISSKSTKISNTSEGTGGASQIRIVTIEITYAN